MDTRSDESAAPPGGGHARDFGEEPRPWAAWGPKDALIGLAMVLGGLLVSGSLALAVADGEPERTLIGLFLQGIVFIAVPLVVASWRSGPGFWRLAGFNRFRAGHLKLVFGALGAQIVATIVVGLLFVPEQDAIIEDHDFDETTLALVLAGIAIVIVAPVAEETLFRGLFFGALRSRLPFLGAALISGLLFGSVHLTTGNVTVAGLLAFFGVLLAYLYERTGSLGPPILLHALNNALAFTQIVAS